MSKHMREKGKPVEDGPTGYVGIIQSDTGVVVAGEWYAQTRCFFWLAPKRANGLAKPRNGLVKPILGLGL
jgi:hypothetical protein